MHPDRILQSMALPKDTRVNQRVPKKLLLENGAPTSADKRYITEGIEEIHWLAALKPTNIGVAPFKDESRDYAEIALVSVQFRAKAKVPRLTELIHRAIPYPLVLIAVQEDGATVSLAHKRFSQAESGKIVIEAVKSTAPIPVEPRPEQDAFLHSLALSAQPDKNLFTLYQSWMHRIDALAAASITGQYLAPENTERAFVRETALDDHTRIQRELAALRASAAKEKQLNRRVELNLRIQSLQSQLDDAMKNL